MHRIYGRCCESHSEHQSPVTTKIRIVCNISYPQAKNCKFEASQNASTSAVTFSGVVADIGSLEAAIRQMQADAKAKYVRIEAALRDPSVAEERLDIVREHGTIEQLIKQVVDLTATVKKLQQTIQLKD